MAVFPFDFLGGFCFSMEVMFRAAMPRLPVTARLAVVSARALLLVLLLISVGIRMPT
jgi:hypothetical protein